MPSARTPANTSACTPSGPSTSPGASERQRPPRRAPAAWVIVAIALPTLMTSLDSLVVTIALPVIHRDLGASVTELQWFVNAYTLTYAALILPTAALGDRLGRNRLFVWAIALFTLASALAALATSPGALIAARTAQGASGAAIGSLSLALLADSVPRRLRELAIGVWGSVNGLGVAAGPIVGGAVVQDLHWSFIFWINIPVGVLSLALVGWSLGVKASGRPGAGADLPGLAAGAGFVFPLTWALVEGGSRGWTSAPILGCLVLAAVSLLCFIRRERRARSAYVPMRLFASRRFNLVNTVAALFSAGIFGSVFLVSQYLQIGMGFGPLESGLRAAPWTMVPMAVAPLAGLLVRRRGPRAVLLTGMVLQTAAVGCFTLLAGRDHSGSAYSAYVLPMLIAGAGMGLTFSPLATAVLVGVPSSDRAVVSGINQTARQLGTATGIALCTAIFTAFGAYAPGSSFTAGLVPALAVCVLLLTASTGLVVAMPRDDMTERGAAC